MKLNYSPRQSGKTTRMIETLARDDRFVLLTFSEKEADRLRNEYHKYIDPKRIMYWKEFKEKRYGRGFGPKVLVDNADLVLEDAVGDYIEEASMTSPKSEFKVLRGKFD